MAWLRRTLDRLYLGCGILACCFLASIALLVVLQVVSRLAGFLMVGLIDYATYAMVASCFLGLALALKRGAHIRVGLLTGLASPAAKRWLEVLALAVGSAVMAYLAWFLFLLTRDSYDFGFRALGLAATPLWIPQAGMTGGAAVAALAFLDELVRVLAGRRPSYDSAEPSVRGE